jgi:hypothetical protein
MAAMGYCVPTKTQGPPYPFLEELPIWVYL